MYDAIIIGGGASGLYCSGVAAGRGLRVAVLEKKARTGIKLSITGKGRCNVTNSASLEDFIKVTRNGKFLYGAYNAFFNSDLITFFENQGVPLKLERGGRYFPVSDKAEDIVKALNSFAKNKGVEIITWCEVSDIEKNGTEQPCFIVNKKYETKNIVIATGGLSYPQTGSTGDGYKFAKQFGHTIIPPLAALVPVTLKSPYLKELNKLKLKNVEVSLSSGEKTLYKDFGEMEFTVFGADGPVILSASAHLPLAGKSTLHINLKPAIERNQLEQRFLKELAALGRLSVKELLKNFLPLQMIVPFLHYVNVNITKKCAEITKPERQRMLNAFYDFSFEIDSTRAIKEAIITRGGVNVDEVNQKTMQSKLVEGLYFCGEVLDIDAPTGGFNLQAAFSSAHLAAINLL
jgi:predicted Rossmann fold flavoprotein